MRKAFVWNELEHWTLPDLVETLQLLGGQDEADDFIAVYAEACEDDDVALHNVGYMAELISHSDKESAEAICDLFGVGFQIEPKHTFGKSSYGIKVEA